MLWDKFSEELFFNETITRFADKSNLFYKDGNSWTAYWKKSSKCKRYTLQSRNSLIGQYTENWVTKLFGNILAAKSLFAINNVICDEIGLTSQSPADVVISKSADKIQNANDILAIFEVKMSIVWNWEYINDEIKCIGDYRTHSGVPSILRSDSVLKAIGKSANIRVSSKKSRCIPIIVLGNAPMSINYNEKVDKLTNSGLLQGFWSLNPCPIDNGQFNDKSKKDGYITISSVAHLQNMIENLIDTEKVFFSSMKSIKELAKIITTANSKIADKDKVNLFIELLED